MKKKNIRTKEEAISEAITWQGWSNEQALSYGEIAGWQEYFYTLAKKFNLVREFKENCII